MWPGMWPRCLFSSTAHATIRPMQDQVHELAKEIGELSIRQGIRLVTAESCTGGGISKVITDLPGSSAWFEAGLVTYSNQAKQALLNVPAQLLEEHGAVSAAVAEAMARGALTRVAAHIAVAVTGIAGPDGGNKEKPVGTVWLAWATVVPDNVRVRLEQFSGDRDTIRQLTVTAALKGVLAILNDSGGHHV